MTIDLNQVRITAEGIARDAATTLLGFFHTSFEQTTKGTPYDIVTDADKAAEKKIVAALQANFPTHHIVGEEGGGMGAPVESAEYRWYVDPLDGTTNFANGIPVFSVSLALTDANMRPLVGVVYIPVADELFSAAVGSGATINGKALQVSNKTALDQCVLASGFAYDKYTNPNNNIAEWTAFLTRTRGLRRLGSAAIDLCYVAAGRFDGYWERALNPWDLLGGVVIVREAGGLVTDYTGDDGDHIGAEGQLVAASPALHPQILDVLATVQRAR